MITLSTTFAQAHVARANFFRRLAEENLKPYFESKGVKLYNADFRHILPKLKTASPKKVVVDYCK